MQSLRSQYLTGYEAPRINGLTYQKRLELCTNPIDERLKQIYINDKESLEKAEKEVINACSEYSDVYMEIGLKMGARLVVDLLNEENNGFRSDI